MVCTGPETLGRRRATLLALALWIIPGAIEAAGASRALLPLRVNRSERGTFPVILRQDDALLRVADLRTAGVSGFAGRRESLDGDEFVSLASLASEASFSLDPETVALDLEVPPAWLGRTVIDAGTARPAGIEYRKDTSGFVNYAFNTRGSLGYDAFAEAGLSVRGDLLYSSVSRAPDGAIVRGLTNYTHDEPGTLRRWIVGDTFASAGGLGGALFLGGATVSRNFDLDPYFIRTPTMALTGAVTTPSTIDVYVNGSIVRRQQIQPGTFDITSLALPAGSGTAEIVVRDAFGQERTLTHPFYAASSVLAAGLVEYAVTIGARRDRVSAANGGYGQPALVAWHRFGLSDRITPGARFEADGDVINAGLSVASRFPFGEIEAEVASSRDSGQSGFAASAVFRHLGRNANYGVFTRLQSDRYANLTLRALQERPTLEASAFAGFVLGHRTSLTAQYDRTTMRDGTPTERLTVSGTVAVSRRASVFGSGGAVRHDGRSGGEAFVGLSWFLGHDTTVSVGRQVQNGASTTSVDVQRSLPLGTGLGYRARAFAGPGREGVSGALQYQTPFGRYEARYDRVNGDAVQTLSASGAIVAIGGALAMTPPVGQSYALIRVPGVAGVMGLSSNQQIARTNRRGDVIVPNLLPYYGNRLGIVDKDLPLDYQIDATEKVVAPPYRGGAIVDFPAHRIRSIRGAVTLVLAAGGEAFPAFGEISVTEDGKTFSSPIGAAGEFELENLSDGRHVAAVESGAGSCTLTIDISPPEGPILDLGTLRCAAKERR